jgi:N-acetylneuraminic acid mutarotase
MKTTRLLAATLALLACASAPAQTLTNISLSPPNPSIGVGTNLQLVPTGTFSDGSSQTLTQTVGGSWTSVASSPTAKSALVAGAVNGKVIAAGGSDPSVYAYDPAGNSWASRASFGNPYNAYAGGAVIGTKLYVIGGCQSQSGTGPDCRIGTTSGLWIYDALADSWSTAASMPTARSSLAAVALDGKIYAAGGVGACPPCPYYNSLEVFDPGSNSWTVKAAMPTTRTACAAAALNHKLYVFGGSNSTNSYLQTVEMYDPSSDTWTPRAPMPTGRQMLGAAMLNGLIYAINGLATTGITNLVEVYNPVTDTWSTVVPTLAAHYLLQPVVLNGTIYIVGSANVESFTPAGPLWSSSNPLVATIATNGIASGLSDGTATITATSGAVSGSTTLTVLSPPTITTAPVMATVALNGTIALSVSATGNQLSYQWLFNQTNLPGATASSLNLTGLAISQAGIYSVIVANAAGAVTNSLYTLSLDSLSMYAGLTIAGQVGANYEIDYRNDLADAWTSLTNILLPSSPYLFIDTGSPSKQRRFYQAVRLP